MKCPSCLVDLTIGERKNIEIDFCPKCRGVWLDRGELDKIIELSNSFEASTPKNENPVSRREDNRGIDNDFDGRRPAGGRRRESFIGDLFDF